MSVGVDKSRVDRHVGGIEVMPEISLGRPEEISAILPLFMRMKPDLMGLSEVIVKMQAL